MRKSRRILEKDFLFRHFVLRIVVRVIVHGVRDRLEFISDPLLVLGT
jgi:hypothetical protein